MWLSTMWLGWRTKPRWLDLFLEGSYCSRRRHTVFPMLFSIFHSIISSNSVRLRQLAPLLVCTRIELSLGLDSLFIRWLDLFFGGSCSCGWKLNILGRFHIVSEMLVVWGTNSDRAHRVSCAVQYILFHHCRYLGQRVTETFSSVACMHTDRYFDRHFG
jgi:hypothetical protein